MSKQVIFVIQCCAFTLFIQLKRLHVYVNTTQFHTQTAFPLKSWIFKPRHTYYKLPDLCGEAVCRFKSNPCWESCQSYVVVPPLPAAAAAVSQCFSHRGITYSRLTKSAQSNYQRQNGIIVSIFREFRQLDLNDQSRRVIFFISNLHRRKHKGLWG